MRLRRAAVAAGIVPEAAVAADMGDAMADPAAEAERARERATAVRADAGRLVAEATAEAQRVVVEAQQRAAELELVARAADEEAAERQADADRDTRMTVLERDLAQASAVRDRLVAEAAGLDAVLAECRDRLAGLAGRRSAAEARRVAARQAADVDGVRAAVTELTAVTEVAMSEASRAEQAEARLGSIRGAGGELERACGDVARTVVELGELRRERDGLPRRAEVIAVAQQLVPMRVAWLVQHDPSSLLEVMLRSAEAGKTGDEAAAARGQMAAAVAAAGKVAALDPSAAKDSLPFFAVAAGPVLLSEIAAWLELLAANNPDAYERVAASAFRQQTAFEPESPPELAPGFAFGPDGTMTYLGPVPAIGG